ncbi:MAG: efflux RND transporter permease subunit, partial [Planctomycetaceae bacterium]
MLPRPGLGLLGAWPGYLAGAQLQSLAAGAGLSLWMPERGWAWLGAVLGFLLVWLLSRMLNAVLATSFELFNRGFEAGTRLYTSLAGLLLKISPLVLLAYAALIWGTGLIFSRTPAGFIPSQDKGYLVLNVRLPDSASLERTQAVMSQVESLAAEVPGVRHTVAIAGQSLLLGTNAPNAGSLYLMLEDFESRVPAKQTADRIADQLRELYAERILDADINVLGAPAIEVLGTAGG